MVKRFTLFLILLFTIPLSAYAVNWGDFEDTNQTIYLYWNTVGTDGVAEALAGGAVGTYVEIYEEGSATQITTADTVDDNFDSITGFHQLAVDLSDSAFENGKTYTVVMALGTVDSVSVVGRIVGVFTVGRYATVTDINGGSYALDTDANGRVRIVDGTGVGEINTNAGAVAKVDLVTTLQDHTPQSGDVYDAMVTNGGSDLTQIPWRAAWDAEVQSEVNDAIVAVHLDHLLAADYDPASKPGVATALLNELVESDAGVSRYTANALEQGPSGGGDGSGFTAIPWNPTWDSEVQSEVNDGLVAVHLDHLLSANYDPASKPGSATALLNELVEDNSGVSRLNVDTQFINGATIYGDGTSGNKFRVTP